MAAQALLRPDGGLGRFVRSAATGGLATAADLAVIALAVGVLGAPARAANLPALFVGAAVQFLGNRYFAFRAAAGSVRRQVALFAATEAVALGLNALLYDLVARSFALGTGGAVIARAITSNLVFVAWSYPVWRRVFRAPAAARA